METCSGVKVMIRDLASGKEGEPTGPYESECGCVVPVQVCMRATGSVCVCEAVYSSV